MGPVFQLELWDTFIHDDMGKCIVGYHLTQIDQSAFAGRKLVLFYGEDFHCSPLHAIDSDACVESVMGFLCLRPGDTDREYFADYTAQQLEFCDQHAEALNCEVQRRFCDEEGRVRNA
jgi:hypothetical protein